MCKYQEYRKLLLKVYDEVVEFLLQKYGPAKDDYYREESYQRFMNGEIKSITKGKHSRTIEGLYCHHIDENKYLNLTNMNFIQKQNVSFKHHRRDRLVYCDLIEHAILHVLIAKETELKLGYPGYFIFLVPNIINWYFDENIPEQEWEKKCYYKSYLNPEEAFNVLKEMEKIIKPFIEEGKVNFANFGTLMLREELYNLENYNSITDYYTEQERLKIEREEQYKQRIDD